MEERKKPERANTGARERQEKAAKTERETESQELARANIAGEEYNPPKEASPAYAPVEFTEASRREKGGKPGSEDEARLMRRANLAGESYESPAKDPELHPPGKKK